MGEPVLIRFLPNIQGKRNFKGPSGRKYRFGGSSRERYVLGEDVDFFVQRADFGLVRMAPSPPSVPPVRKPPPVAPPKEKALTDITGIGPASARKLREAGISTAAGIMDKTPEELAKILGFPLGRTRKVIQNSLEQM